MFDTLAERLQSIIHDKLPGNTLTLEAMEDAVRDIRRALIDADVSLPIIKAFLTRIQERVEGEKILSSVNASQQLIKLVHDELVRLLGQEAKPLTLTATPTVILLLGLQGSGKTTTCGKLAQWLLKTEQLAKQPLLIAADVYRPAAIQQLQTLGERVGAPVFTLPGETDVVRIVREGLAHAKSIDADVVLIDTAGRLQVDTDMMAELLLVERIAQPQEKLLVVDGMTGQAAVDVALAFNTQIGVTGLVLTKLDGDARGGAALSLVETTGCPIRFLGVSETLEGLEPFYPDRMANRILGMGDVVSLVEKAQKAFDVKAAQRLDVKLREQRFDFNDFMALQGQLKMLGSLDSILGMLPIPGLTKQLRDTIATSGEGQMKHMQVIIQSMTAHERETPDCLSKPRMARIAKGAGVTVEAVEQMVGQFNQMRVVMKQMSQMGQAMQDDVSKRSLPQGGDGLSMPRRMKPNKQAKMQQQMQQALTQGKKGGFPGLGGFPGGGLPFFGPK